MRSGPGARPLPPPHPHQKGHPCSPRPTSTPEAPPRAPPPRPTPSSSSVELRRGLTVTPTPAGGASITWTARRLTSGGGVTEEPRSITLTPHTPIPPLTDQTRADLTAIDQAGAAFVVVQGGRTVIQTGLQRIGSAATSRLYGHRLVLEERGRVRLTLVAYLALLADRNASPEAVAAVLRPEFTSASA
ncbi:hypothetical protein ACF09H_29760 [Streptomyces sp. NPDC014983]|uniref:hypothetical protein n=1 Tax=Streptomyces sp. NPDC014983 TaxID=3364933 RepID=UPI0036FCF212